MAGVMTVDGKTVAINMLTSGADSNRGNSYKLGLFLNSTGLSATSVLADLIEPTGVSYARIEMQNTQWVTTALSASFPQQTFTATVAITGIVNGYFIATTGVVPKLLAYELFTTPFTFNTGDALLITPSIAVA